MDIVGQKLQITLAPVELAPPLPAPPLPGMPLLPGMVPSGLPGMLPGMPGMPGMMPPMLPGMPGMLGMPGMPMVPGMPPVALPPPPPPAVAAAAAAAAAATGPEVEEKISNEAEDGGGMKLTAQSRAALMNKLAANAGIDLSNVPQLPPLAPRPPPLPTGVPDALAHQQGMLGPASPIPTPCLLLKNMFNPEE